MKQLLLIAALLVSVATCASDHNSQSADLTGSWDYDLMINGTLMGTSKTSVTVKNNRFTYRVIMTMKGNGVTSTVDQTIIETLDFQPVEMTSISTIIQGDMKRSISTRATAQGNTISLTRDGKTMTIPLEGTFYFNGNYLMNEIIKKDFKPGLSFTAKIYDPTLEPSQTVPVTVSVVGKEKVKFRGKSVKLIHIRQKIENLKHMDLYVDKQGILYMASMSMLNNNLVLIKKP